MRYFYLQSASQSLGYGMDVGRDATFVWVYDGENDGATPLETAERAFVEHNRGDRPRGREIRSMSVGDVIVTTDGTALMCMPVGWEVIRNNRTAEALQGAAHRQAYVMVEARHLPL